MKDYIETRVTQFGDETPEAHQSRVQQFLARNHLPIIRDWKPRGAIEAFVNDGRWIAECPETGCGGAEFVAEEWPVFVCSSGCGCGPFAVEFPKDKGHIEAELLRRPVPGTRAWRPKETVADLKKENKAHGLD